jgi:hypothetical protein
MARIETYILDGNISVNDYVIGTDGDSLNATKNYKILTFLDYLGRLYNLNSTDLLFNYVTKPSTMVSNGEVTTNNYLDGVILMSGVSNIYVSKLSAFGQLVDEILTTIGNENLTIMFADMGNRNNLGIFTVTSAVDVDANTINLSVVGTTTVGSIDEGKVMGVRIGVGGTGTGGGGLQNIVEDLTPQLGGSLDTKGFGIESTASGAVFSLLSPSLNRRAKQSWQTNDIYLLAGFTGTTAPNNPQSLGANFNTGEWTIGANRILTTLDLTTPPNLSNYVTTNTTQEITGLKTFSNVNKTVFKNNDSAQIDLSQTSSGNNVVIGAGSNANFFASLGMGFDFRVNGETTPALSITSAKVPRFTGLSGTGDRMVVASTTGILSTQAIPSASNTSYVGTINQSGTSSPSVTVLDNSTGLTITWSRASTGNYTGTITGGTIPTTFTGFVTNTSVVSSGSIAFRVERATSTTISVKSTLNGTLSDNLIGTAHIELRIY